MNEPQMRRAAHVLTSARVQLQPQRSLIYTEMGRLEQYRRNPAEARDMYALALDYDPTNVVALNSIGLLLTHDSEQCLWAFILLPDIRSLYCVACGTSMHARVVGAASLPAVTQHVLCRGI